MSEKKLMAGVMGWPVEHSLSPRIHGAWLKQYGIDGSYVALPVKPEELGVALKALPAKGFRGVNITAPHKEAALAYLDEIEPNAKRIGAVNTVIVRDDGKLEGRNTDVYGFAQNLLSAGYKYGGKPVVMIGAGGAARAGVAALLEMGVREIRIVNRTSKRAEELVKAFGPALRVFEWSDTVRAFDGAELLVNATSLGMTTKEPLRIDLDHLPLNALVADMVNVPLETELLRAAKARGNKTVDGLGMLLHQARPAFKAFFGKDPEVTEQIRAVTLGSGA